MGTLVEKKNLGKTVIIIATIAMATEVVALVVTEAVETGEIAKGAIAKVVTEVVVVVSVVVSMTETILVILFQLEIIFHPEIASSCPRNNPIPTIILQKKPKKRDQALVKLVKREPEALSLPLVHS